jgi:hypothetical protein
MTQPSTDSQSVGGDMQINLQIKLTDIPLTHILSPLLTILFNPIIFPITSIILIPAKHVRFHLNLSHFVPIFVNGQFFAFNF